MATVADHQRTRTDYGLRGFSPERMERRAIELALWGMPIVSTAAMRRAFFAAGAEYGDVVYFSKPADEKFQITTPNMSTYYANITFNTAQGPVVVEIPPAEGAGIFGSFNDAWQIPAADFGPTGEDAGKGGKYLLLPPGYTDAVPEGYIPVRLSTFNGYSWSRMIPASASAEDVRAAIELVKRVETYPLPRSGESRRPTRHIDVAGKLYDGLASFDLSFYETLAQMIDEEPVLEYDLVAMNLARSVGIAKGQRFEPNDETAAVLTSAIAKAHEELVEAASRIHPLFPNVHWGLHGLSGIATAWTFRTEDSYDIDDRGVLFYLACAPSQKPGAASFYLMGARDGDGEVLDGSASYRLRVPANVPVEQYWAITVYDLSTGGFMLDSPRSSVDSYGDLTANDDGSVDLQFSSDTPTVNDSNWVYVTPGKPFLAIFRFYGPEPAVRDGSWVLPDLEKLNGGGEE